MNIFYLLGDSNINVTVSALSPAFNVMTSSLLAHFRTLDMLHEKIKTIFEIAIIFFYKEQMTWFYYKMNITC